MFLSKEQVEWWLNLPCSRTRQGIMRLGYILPFVSLNLTFAFAEFFKCDPGTELGKKMYQYKKFLEGV